MSHKPNLLSWDQDVAASPREFHETDNNRTNSATLLATWQYFSFRHIWFSKLLSHQKLSQIILSYFSNALSFEQGKRSFQISGKLSSFAKMSLSMGISEEIEDAKITAEKTKISKLKRRSENYPKFA